MAPPSLGSFHSYTSAESQSGSHWFSLLSTLALSPHSCGNPARVSPRLRGAEPPEPLTPGQHRGSFPPSSMFTSALPSFLSCPSWSASMLGDHLVLPTERHSLSSDAVAISQATLRSCPSRSPGPSSHTRLPSPTPTLTPHQMPSSLSPCQSKVLLQILPPCPSPSFSSIPRT